MLAKTDPTAILFRYPTLLTKEMFNYLSVVLSSLRSSYSLHQPASLGL